MIKEQWAKEPRAYFCERKILDWMYQIGQGVKACHDRRIIHRDLKPANIFLTKNSKIIRVGDFGVTRQFGPTSKFATRSQQGTPTHWSPELASGSEYTTKYDVWSVGVIFYELCALDLPFSFTPQRKFNLASAKGKVRNNKTLSAIILSHCVKSTANSELRTSFKPKS